MHDQENNVPIWLFIGSLLSFYGLLITASGIWNWVHPPPTDARVALWHLHADVWWGLLLIAVGLFYVIRFRPRSR